jgi:uncharacterized protein (TIGR02001 family)
MRYRFLQFTMMLCASTGIAHASEGDSANVVDEPGVHIALLSVENNRPDSLRRPDPAKAETPESGPALSVDNESFLVEATLSLVSDFRRGGMSSTRGKPALQGSVAVEHKSGLFGSLWASNVANNGGADIEVDVALGYAFEIGGGLDAEIGIIGYAFPGVNNSSYVELQGALSSEFGPATIGVSVAYSPAQGNIGDRDNIYFGTAAELPLKTIPMTLRASMGIEDGAFGDKKVDWSLGANYVLWGFDLGADYVDSARTFGTPDAGPTVVVSISKTI